MLKAKKIALKTAREEYNEKGGKIREKKLFAAQKAVLKLETCLSKINKELDRLKRKLTTAKKIFVQISKEASYYGLSKKEYDQQYKKSRKRNTNGYKRKKELDSSKNGIKMLKRAVKKVSFQIIF